MESRVSPSYTNIFMGLFVEAFIYPFHKQILIYLKHIDDVVMLWDHDKKSLNTFFNHFNVCHVSIKFSFRYPKQTVNFLGVSTKKLSPSNSSGNQPLKANPYSTEAINQNLKNKEKKTKSPTASSSIYKESAQEMIPLTHTPLFLHNELLKLKYSAHLFMDALNRATAVRRGDLLTRTTHSHTDKLSLVTSFHASLKSTSFWKATWTVCIQTKNWLFPSRPLLLPSVTYLVLVVVYVLPCGCSHCPLCKFILTSSKVSSYTLPFSMKITHTRLQKAKHPIHTPLHTLLQTICERKSKLNKWTVYDHESAIVHKENKPVSNHFNNPTTLTLFWRYDLRY